MNRGAGTALLLLALVACDGPAIPVRTPAYGFDDPTTGDVFRWPANRLPVRVWADPRGTMPQLAAAGLRAWEQLFLYGEFRGIVVDDSVGADIVVRWADSVPPNVAPDPGPAVFACDGLTRFSVGAANRLDDYIRIDLGVRFGYTEAQVAACVARVATHELGHALGILQHSPDTVDLMHANPRASGPSDGDRRTIEVLYHTEPTIAPWR